MTVHDADQRSAYLTAKAVISSSQARRLRLVSEIEERRRAIGEIDRLIARAEVIVDHVEGRHPYRTGRRHRSEAHA